MFVFFLILLGPIFVLVLEIFIEIFLKGTTELYFKNLVEAGSVTAGNTGNKVADPLRASWGPKGAIREPYNFFVL